MSWLKQLRFATVVFSLLGFTCAGQTYLSEILFEPPGADLPNQYIEIRGTPNGILAPGTYVVAVAGDAGDGPGTIQNVFDLSGKVVGGNGFLVLLQKSHGYSVSSNATVLANTGSGGGFGSGASSSIGHRGKSGRTDLPHASVTFFLVQTTNAPAPGSDIDSNDDGVPGGQVFESWHVLDSVGIAADAGDIAYGAVNYKKSSGATASGVVVSVLFTPVYAGRTGNTTNSAATSWVTSGSLDGVAPNWALSSTKSVPRAYSGLGLNHLGMPNFGANSVPGVVAIQSGGSTDVFEGRGMDSYLLGLNTVPTGAVVLQLSASGQTQISIDGGTNFFSSRALSLSNISMSTVIVRALGDNVIEPSPQVNVIHHTVVGTEDPTGYPLSSLTPDVLVNVFNQEELLLNEINVNPPGTNDAPCEFVEIRGPPSALLRDVYLLGIDGEHDGDPGAVKLAIDLSGVTLGTSGLLAITAEGNPYGIPATTTVITAPRFNQPGSALNNGAISFLLVSSPSQIIEGKDLDAGDNGVLEGLPEGTTILDAVGWKAGNADDVTYGGVGLDVGQTVPDAVGRFPTNSEPLSVSAWYYGELAGTNCGTLVFDATQVSSNFPTGVILSPGRDNRIDVQITSVGPLSGVLGDPTNPGLSFRVMADGIAPDALVTTAFSSTPQVVPDGNLSVVPGPGGQRTLYINPVGVGYATITVTVFGGDVVGQFAFPYAASAMGRWGGIWHTGTSDGSTAINITPELMLVGDNENNVVRLYDRYRSGAPSKEFDWQVDLGLSPQEHGEVNIEASTRSGNRIYFCGAHSNSNLAESRTNRNRIFAVDLSGTGLNTGLTYVGRYDHLKDDLLKWDSTNCHGKGTNYYGLAASAADAVNPKAPDGFNIEGLSMAPGSASAAWLGFRAPIVPVTNRTYALIIPVLNYTALSSSGGLPGSAVFGAPIELDLYGRGIRSMEGTSNGFIICAGPPGDVQEYPNDFKLYTWTGNPEDAAQQRDADLSGLQPEGIVELPAVPWTAESQIQLISDNGTTIPYDDGIPNKKLSVTAFRKFRSDWVTLGRIVKPVPIILKSDMTSTNLTITWRALKGETYRVQFTSALNAAPWMDASPDITASGPFASAVVPRMPEADRGFYRVSLIAGY
jgi:hypothetical protein